MKDKKYENLTKEQLEELKNIQILKEIELKRQRESAEIIFGTIFIALLVIGVIWLIV